MLRLPKGFEEILKAYVKETYYKGTRKADFAKREFTEGDYRFFAKGVAELNRYFTAERSTLPKNYFNKKELRSGYLLYFLPTNALKIAGLLNQLPSTFFKRRRAILDLGSGPATGIIGTLLHTGKRWSGSVTLVDQNRDILQEGKRLFEKMSERGICRPPDAVRLITADFCRIPLKKVLPKERYDLIIVSNVLNELTDQRRRLEVIRFLLQKVLAPKGQLLIMEPALRRSTRELMQLRDEICEQQIAGIHAPCLHQAACPMLAANRRDWCHSYLEWERPELIEMFDRLVGIRKTYLKASYLLLGRRGKPPCLPVMEGGHRGPPLQNLWRVVSGPLNSKGKTERLLCGEATLPHLHRLMLLTRDQSRDNHPFEQAQRGDIIATDAKNRIRKQDKVQLLT